MQLNDMYYEEQLELQKHDLRKSWKTIKEILGKSNTREKHSLEFTINGVHIKNNQFI